MSCLSSPIDQKVRDHHKVLQQIVESLGKDISIKYHSNGGGWFFFCPSIRQAFIISLMLATEFNQTPKSLTAINPSDGHLYHGFHLGKHHVLICDDSKRLNNQEVREHVAELLTQLSRFTF